MRVEFDYGVVLVAGDYRAIAVLLLTYPVAG
jgi:hypothetical protein